MANTKQLCTFYVAGDYFGIPVEKVQEVVRPQPITPVPLAPRVIRGLINLRGQILTALDLRYRLGLGEPGEHAKLMNVVVRNGDSAMSFLVDEIGEVLDVLQCDLTLRRDELIADLELRRVKRSDANKGEAERREQAKRFCHGWNLAVRVNVFGCQASMAGVSRPHREPRGIGAFCPRVPGKITF